MSYLFGIVLLFFSPARGFARETIFEGYYAIKLQGKAVGYQVQRYEFDAKTRTFHSLSFLRAKFGDKLVQESLQAKASDKFKPISYQYTSQTGDVLQMIDATFTGDIMKIKASDGKKLDTKTFKIPKGTFLSTFLPFLLLTQKLESAKPFKYSAVAEEDGNSYDGRAMVQSHEHTPGYDLVTLVNKFKGDEFYSKMAIVPDPKNLDKNTKGEVLSVEMPTKDVTIKLVPQASLATEGQIVPNTTLAKIFGGMPVGKINLLATPPEVVPEKNKATPPKKEK